MKFAPANPNWRFEGSIYFGCHEPHPPLEYGYDLKQFAHMSHIQDQKRRPLAELSAVHHG